MNLLSTTVLAAVPELGGYFNIGKVVCFLLLPLPWLYASGWLDKDAPKLKANRPLWLSMVFGGGIALLLLWLLIPLWAAGAALFFVGSLALSLVYVSYRNARVVPEARVLTSEHLSSLFVREKKQSEEVRTRLKLYDAFGKPLLPPAEGTEEEKHVYNLVQDLLYDIMWRRASEVDLAPTQNLQAVRFVIDGVVVQRPSMEKADAEGVIDFIKGQGGMDVTDKRRPQQGKISVDLAAQPIDIRLVAAGSTAGQRLQMKVVQEAIRTRIGELGLPEDVLKKLRELAALSPGLMIVSARPGNGLTSTQYSLLRDNDAYIKQLVTVEQEVEADLENITQHRYRTTAEMPRVLAGVMRRDPDVVLVDKVEDKLGAEGVLEAAAEKKVILGVSASDSFSALARWAQVVGGARRAAEPLQAVVCQVLVRKLCPQCKEAYRPDAEMLRKANIPGDKIKNFYRPPTKPLTDEKGNPITCPTCQGSGYMGRTAAFELLEITDDLRKLIGSGANLTQIKAAARKNKMLYLQEAALRLVMDGVTSVQEVIRVTKTKQEAR